MIKRKRIVIFDLDDTLIHSEAKIKVFDSETNELVSSLTPTQFNYHVPGQAQFLAFDDFECEKILGRSKIYLNTWRSFKRYYSEGVPVSIITARSNDKIVLDFFKSKKVHLKPSMVYAIHNRKYDFHGNVAERKKQAIQRLIKKGYNDITFYDDNLDNLKAASELNSDSVTVKIIHVTHA